MAAAQSWESLKAKAKSLKADLDTKMQDLGRLNKRLSTATAATPADRVAELDGQIQRVAGLRDEVTRGLSEFEEASAALADVAATSAQAAQAARFRETHQEMVRDFKRIAQSIDHQYQHARLLPKKSTAGKTGDEEDQLLREGMGLRSSLSMADEIIGQASATRDMLSNQRQVLGGVQSRVGSLNSMFPGISQLIDKISDRQNKERIVLSITIASCCIFTIWYKFF
eukprot:TRINITY_DN78583_c0_g1_i1.p1 TRINITY_DN78583_c0_g1~~TRINITY_DN78583_c0_g1_i1.p1  ORF type:complete len:241 (-),score=50.75 TRINITY_DN78583_c0_g1_i1:89-766(-)